MPSDKLRSYPLCWPDNWQRTPPSKQRSGHFKSKRTTLGEQGRTWTRAVDITIADAVARVLEQLRAMKVRRDDVVISTNLPTRLDGLPRSDQSNPKDAAAAVYWRAGTTGPPRCIAIDVYRTVADNLGAIAATLEAMRAMERHGGAQVQERTFRGFAALPAQTSFLCWDVLELPANSSTAEIEASFKRLLRTRHPDAGGSHDAMAELNRARTEALSLVEVLA